MKNIFFNISENRIRSGFRVLIYLLVFLVISGFIRLILKTFISIQIISSLIYVLFTPVVALGTLKLVGRYIDHRKFKEYGFHLSRRWWLDFTFGIVLGATLIGAIFLLENALEWIKIVEYFKNQREGYIGMPFLIPLVIGLIFYISVGVYEEIFFRSCQITNFAEGFYNKNINAKKALILAYVLSSILFSLVHSANPNITLVGLLNIILMGFFLGLPYILSGEIAISIALHISWNIFQGLVFGFPVSGVQNNLSIIAMEQGGPQLWTGGAFGIEGGLLCTFAAILGGGLVLLWFKILKRPISLHTTMAEYDSQNFSRQDSI